ncbi:MAG: tetraacyldisaccharide 4'-kinase [Desulfobacterales bacterium]|nr:tetraacyldisaccharide 4'-kinase [Desulfobacterales bacterium]MDJ0886980.1 tetraacyldisaccharide 4'-kinase [Desulfobacterales bacterium]
MKDSRVNPLTRLKKQVTAVIHSRGPDRIGLAAVLRVFAALFGVGVRLRTHRYRRRQGVRQLACRVVSIGNLAVGGTGKTPLCIYLARVIHDAGLRVAIVSRGYHGRAEKTGARIEPDGAFAADAGETGDEPVLMARLLHACSIPVYVGRDRLASGRRALARFKPDVILLDDGFQHQRLARDLDIVLLDGQAPLGNGYLLPRGPLREPPSALDRADILVLTRAFDPADGKPPADGRRQLYTACPHLAAKPLFACRHRPVGRERIERHPTDGPRSGPLNLEALRNLPVLAFSGIARNDAFRQTLIDLGAELRGWMAFDDHYHYRAGDLIRLTREGRRAGVNALVTTDKDRVRIQDDWVQGLPLLVIGVAVDFGRDRDAFERHVLAKLGTDRYQEEGL